MIKTKSLISAASTLALAISAVSVSSVTQASPHSNYVAPQATPSAPSYNCRWYQAFCQTKYNFNYAGYLIKKARVNNKNYQNRYNTQYPIVLVHGVSGFDKILGVVEYFQGIPAALRRGNAVVYTPNVTAWDTAEMRGEQLLDYIENVVLPETGASQVHLVGHSLGSPTSRYVAGVSPELVSSVTSVNGINYGSGFADWGVENFVDGPLEGIAVNLINLTGNVLDALAGNPEYSNDALESIKFMSTERALAFSEEFSDGEPTSYCGNGANLVNGVHYYSWGSTGTFTNLLDISDPLMALFGQLGYFNGEANDGLVAKCSQHWGENIRDNYWMNHLDATNMLFGLHNLLETNPKTLYKNHADRFRGMGL
ncbi:MAG: triacylglycerol lipase [Oleiphilaceae bacterium]|jgi:triacylglycerol lipase